MSDHSSVMNSEPERCRRTDGRKWRCSKVVVPHQKYCERHMHRGRRCSRKQVEPVEKISMPNKRASDDNKMPVMSLVASDIDSRVSISVQSNPSPSQPRSSYRRIVPNILKYRNNEAHDDALLANNSIRATYPGSTCSSSRANCSTSGGDHADGNSSFVDANPINISNRKQKVVGDNYAGFTSSRFGLSPKRVLNAAGEFRLGSGCKTIMEAEPQRCQRTDGRKWQCRRDSIPNHKFCEAHKHRGRKRLKVITRNHESGINLNTVPASPQHAMCNDSSSSMSDATTITDENISVCLSDSLHND